MLQNCKIWRSDVKRLQTLSCNERNLRISYIAKFRLSIFRNGTSEKYKVQEPNKSRDFYNKLHFYTLSITKVSQ